MDGFHFGLSLSAYRIKGSVLVLPFVPTASHVMDPADPEKYAGELLSNLGQRDEIPASFFPWHFRVCLCKFVTASRVH